MSEKKSVDEEELDRIVQEKIKKLHSMNLSLIKEIGEILERQPKEEHISARLINDLKNEIPSEEVLRCINELGKTAWLK